MNHYGLIGKNIAYSFSENYFQQKFQTENRIDSKYRIFDLPSLDSLELLIETEKLKGFNVTIPYKEQIIPFLDQLSPEAAKIGAVNCVKLIDQLKVGFNTDVYGFAESLKPLLEPHHQKALVLGDGGAAKAVKFVLNEWQIDFKTVSRKGEFKFTDLNQEVIENHQIIINTTPLGTYPNSTEKPSIPYRFLNSKHLVFDLIYNPEKTEFLRLAEEKGAKIKNGYEMLVLQAEKSWEIWTQTL